MKFILSHIPEDVRAKILAEFLDEHTKRMAIEVSAAHEALGVPLDKETFLSMLITIGAQAVFGAAQAGGPEMALRLVQMTFQHEFAEAVRNSKVLRDLLTDDVLQAAQRTVEEYQAAEAASHDDSDTDLKN